MQKFLVQHSPVRIPATGEKVIEEHFGLATSGTETFSLAHMVAPAFWSEPPQTPDFAELTIMIRGRMLIEADGEKVVVNAGESFWVQAGVRVQYANPFDEPSEYWAVCYPAFSLPAAHREAEDATLEDGTAASSGT